MKIRYILLVAVMLVGTGFGQYLTYEEMESLLKIVHDDAQVDEFLVKRGFEYDGVSDLAGTKSHKYSKFKDENYYLVSVLFEKSIAYRAVSESSYNIKRWNYFKNILNGAGYKLTDQNTSESGTLEITYKNKKYVLTMTRTHFGQNLNLYHIILTNI